MEPPKPRLGLLGNPENRRVRDFVQARRRLGHPDPVCLAYEELLSDPGAVGRLAVDRLRIDSPGENEAVARGLIALGGGPAQADLVFGEVGYLREYHRGFCRLLERVEESGVACLNHPRDIALMFDKWACHQRFVRAGLARPPSELAPTNLRDLLQPRRCGRIFLKPLHGSSASGVCALCWSSSRMELVAPLRLVSAAGRTALVNSLKVVRYTDRTDIEVILGQLLPQGMIAEQWVPKLTLADGAVDLRVLVIAGEARHRVVRQSRHPMTNLHLGNRRAEEAVLLQELGPERFERALSLAEQAAACFPEALYAGVDILLDRSGRALVGEINAFGDLLPRLMHRGETAYAALARVHA